MRKGGKYTFLQSMLRSPSLLGDRQFLQVSRSKALFLREGTTVITRSGILRSLVEQQVEHNFDANLCRCTGQRPIIDAIGEYSSGGSSCGRYNSSILVPLDTADQNGLTGDQDVHARMSALSCTAERASPEVP